MVVVADPMGVAVHVNVNASVGVIEPIFDHGQGSVHVHAHVHGHDHGFDQGHEQDHDHGF